MILETDSSYMTDIKSIESVMIVEQVKVKISYTKTDKTSWNLTQTCNTNSDAVRVYKAIVAQIKAQDPNNVDKAFEQAFLKE